jgi:hypothetical protein
MGALVKIWLRAGPGMILREVAKAMIWLLATRVTTWLLAIEAAILS